MVSHSIERFNLSRDKHFTKKPLNGQNARYRLIRIELLMRIAVRQDKPDPDT